MWTPGLHRTVGEGDGAGHSAAVNFEIEPYERRILLFVLSRWRKGVEDSLLEGTHIGLEMETGLVSEVDEIAEKFGGDRLADDYGASQFEE